jgi:magnesium chelatase family protein
VRGVLPCALQAGRLGHTLLVPEANGEEGLLAPRARVLVAAHLRDVCRFARGEQALAAPARRGPALDVPVRTLDLADVRGQAGARRALEIAAAGEHSLLLIGPPGSGKSMLAQRLPGLLPPLSEAEAIETAAVRSLTPKGLNLADWRCRPFRAPHHTASAVALVGGGGRPRPGEISLAHNGVLFLDELPEFDRHVLEVLREPLESGHIVLSRAARQAEYPARFQLVAAMNPCPCGHYGDARCRCPPERIEGYRSRVSGPLLDRIDLHVAVGRVAINELADATRPESTREIAARVQQARLAQGARQQVMNARLGVDDLTRLCMAEPATLALLTRAMQQLALSARAYHRVLRVARTIADLAGREKVASEHIAEAITLRQLDRRSMPAGAPVPS